MHAISRFVLDDKRNVIDVLNPTGRKSYCHEGAPETQIDLRDRVLLVRLGDIVDDLIERQPESVDRFGIKYRPHHPARHSIWIALYSFIRATHLFALDPAVALDKRFSGELNRKKIGLQSFTSLALFTDDVERLLRDLYGDVEGLGKIVRAVLVLAEELARYANQALWQEHQDAESWDYCRGIGVPDGYGISGSQHGRGLEGADNLRLRARQVSEAPSHFGKYTVEFATKYVPNFIGMERPSLCDDELPF